MHRDMTSQERLYAVVAFGCLRIVECIAESFERSPDIRAWTRHSKSSLLCPMKAKSVGQAFNQVSYLASLALLTHSRSTNRYWSPA